ncbi:MAG: hypothetical protein RIR49_1374 [Actinomycetota bacterium]
MEDARRIDRPLEDEDLERQRRLLLDWLGSDDASATAARLLRRRDLDWPADDLINDAWIRIVGSLERRSQPLPDLDVPAKAARYAARVLDNLARDRLRERLGRREVSLEQAMLGVASAPSTSGHEDGVTDRVLLEQLLHAVAQRAGDGVRCAGCPGEVVAAAALEVIHMVLLGDEGGRRGRSWMDRVLRSAIERVDPTHPESPAARDQRVSRCGRCASDLLAAGMSDLMGAPA